MLKLLLTGSLFGVAIWFLSGELAHKTAPQSPVAPATTPTSSPSPLSATRAAAPMGAPTVATAPSPASAKPVLNGATLRNRIEEQIPRQLYAEAARCYRGGLDKDKRLDVTYHLRVSNGDVSIDDLRTIENTLDDSALERCIHDRILAKKWHDDVLPNLEEDDDLYMRVGELQTQMAAADRR